MEIVVWVLSVATFLLLLAGLVLQFLERSAARNERQEAKDWRTHFGNRFISLEQAVHAQHRPDAPQLQPAFTVGDSVEPSFGAPLETGGAAGRGAWAPPIRK